MKVLLIRPPKIQGALEKSMVQHPINLLYIAAVLQESGFEPVVWDFEVEPFSGKIVSRRLKELGPAVVGITGMTCNIGISHKIMGLVKAENRDILRVVGGPHATAIPERTLEEFPDFDVAVRQEGELSFREVCERVRDGKSLERVLGVTYRRGDKIVSEDPRPFIEDLDTLPLPARDLIDHSLYKGASSPGLDATLHRSTELFTTRGCPEKCIFCAAHLTHGHRVRCRSAENVLQEVDECMARWGYRHFTIEDDTFTYHPARIRALCQGFIERGITWDCDSRVNTVNRDMIKMMAEAGCQKIAFGVESGSARILKLINKNINLDQVRQAFKWAHEAGMITTAFMMVGSHPSETEYDLELSERLMKEIDTDLMALSLAVPFPGTDLHNIMKEKNLIMKEQWYKFTHLHSVPSWRTDKFSPDQLVRQQDALYRHFFLRTSFIYRTMKKAMSWHGLRYYARSMLYIMRYLFIERRN